MKQFLLNPDGSVPLGVNLEVLAAAGIPLVLPTPPWVPEVGMQLEERGPAQDKDGVWRQVWVEVPVPPVSPETE